MATTKGKGPFCFLETQEKDLFRREEKIVTGEAIGSAIG